HNMAGSVVVRHQEKAELQRELASQGLGELPTGVTVYSIEGPFFFAAVESFEQLLAHGKAAPQVVVIRLRHVPFIDATGLQTLDDVIDQLRGRGVRVILTEMNERVSNKMRRMGLLKRLGEGNVLANMAEVIAHLE